MKRVALFLALALVALGGMVLWLHGDAEDTKPHAEPVASMTAATTAKMPAPVAPTVTFASASPPAANADATSTDLTREDIEAAVMAKDPSALANIERVDLTKDGHVAAAAIDAVGKLAATASDPAKKEAVRTLDAWLRQESKRTTADARGNVSILVDALADTGSDDAIAPLVSALDSASYPLHVETRMVQSLERLDAKSAAPSVERFAARVAKLTPTDDMDKALAKEAADEATAALAKWK